MRHRRRALRRRYGRASGGPKPKIIHRMLTGGLVWNAPGSTQLQIMWNGPGSPLRMGFNLLKAGSPYPGLIHHPGSNGHYATAKEAKAAVNRFFADHAKFMKG